MLSWDDIQSFCDDLSQWMIETNTVDQIKIAHPRSDFPLKADPSIDDEQESWEILVYLTLWVCLKKKIKAPSHLESRILLSDNIKGPWVRLYVKLIETLKSKPNPEPTEYTIESIWNLAG